MSRKDKLHIHQEVNQIVATALRKQVETENLSPVERETTLLEALAMVSQELSPLDRAPIRRSKEEYLALPIDNESLRERGVSFLHAFGISVPEKHVLFANRDDLLEITITDPTVPTLIAQATLTVTRKGEKLAASLGEFLEGIAARNFIAKPSQLQELERLGLDLSLFIDEALGKSEDRAYGVRDHYDLEVTDEEIGETLSGTIHLLQAASEVCTSKSISFAQPLMIVETNIRNRWPYQGATKEVLILTDPIPSDYECIVDLMQNATQNERKRLEGRITKVAKHIGSRLTSKRGITLPLDLPIDELYLHKRTGRLLITALGYALPNVDGWYDQPNSYNDDDGGEEHAIDR